MLLRYYYCHADAITLAITRFSFAAAITLPLIFSLRFAIAATRTRRHADAAINDTNTLYATVSLFSGFSLQAIYFFIFSLLLRLLLSLRHAADFFAITLHADVFFAFLSFRFFFRRYAMFSILMASLVFRLLISRHTFSADYFFRHYFSLPLLFRCRCC